MKWGIWTMGHQWYVWYRFVNKNIGDHSRHSHFFGHDGNKIRCTFCTMEKLCQMSWSWDFWSHEKGNNRDLLTLWSRIFPWDDHPQKKMMEKNEKTETVEICNIILKQCWPWEIWGVPLIFRQTHLAAQKFGVRQLQFQHSGVPPWDFCAPISTLASWY